MATVVDSIVQPDESAIKAHLDLLFAPLREEYPGGLIELRYGSRFSSAYFNLREDGCADAASFAASRSRAGDNVYVGVNPRKPSINLRRAATDEDVEVAIWHFADIDKAESLHGLGKKLRPLPVFYSADTGTVPHRRPHLYWLLDEPVWHLSAWTERQRGIAQALGGDAVINPSRIMRLAGTVNFPTQDKLKRGYKTEIVTLKTEFEDEREAVTPDEVAVAYPVPQGFERIDPATGEVVSVPAGETTLSAMARGSGVRPSDYIGAILAGDSWHNNYRDLVAHWISIGWTDAEILLTAPGLTLAGYTVADTERAVRQYIRSARDKFGVPEPTERTVEETKRAEEVAAAFKATPFTWRAEESIPPRKWLYGRHLLRKFLSVDIAGGGVGKSSLKIGEALAMAADRAIYGTDISEGPLNVWLYNLEDPSEETERRLHAAAKRFAIKPEDVNGRLFVDSGRDQPCVLAEETKDGVRIAVPIVDALIAQIKARKIDVLVIDPFVSSHDVSENDNGAIDKVAKQWAKIADICDCSINLVHHVRKQNGAEATADSARGAKSLTDAARSVRVYNKMTKEEAEAAGITPEEASFIFRVQNDKVNLSPPEKAEWFRMNNTDLANGDQVGVACPWAWPDPFDGVSIAHLRAVQTLIGKDEYREDVRAAKWAGKAIAEVLQLDTEDKANRKRITSILKEWIRNGALEVVEIEDAHRKTRKQVIVGKWAGE